MNLINLFKSGKLTKIAHEATKRARKEAKEANASIYYKLGKDWIREDAQGKRFIVKRNQNGEKTEISYL
ncbi:hypothetical protein SAMN05444392_10651 [Seinonella peptonophila]|uniref:Uncharacterized protein n=1 Tax=Seinonella peptonophila TaxID=112248 RepID=A0A1M4Y5E1_9BACL|nr:hypothetical protein [Seinonella peptonophila]SHF00890.1 hypothetical protein SAMN05444392_10651 [Seinonella peptonophila]